MTAAATSSAPALWGGIECTVNRTRSGYQSQIDRNGHAWRVGDLDAIAALGVRALRYPVLWELTAPERDLQSAGWQWPDERLTRLRELGVEPIVGLVHHGSGPAYTDLLDPDFAPQLARYARAVAERYPWVECYTPVNEPLTTARFSALYGLWYPHASDDRSFVRALLNQLRGTVMAMQAIREVNPRARLLQTEDLGRVYARPRLLYQADFENERRWLTWDLLCGRVDAQHPLWRYLLAQGARPDEILWFHEHACPPDCIGINHYVTSDRFLDERLHLWPSRTHGGNARAAYADVEAVRALAGHESGFRRPLQEAWARYGLPLAITEVHLGCSRDEQARWLWQAWCTARAARRQGIDVQAVTAWALLGSFDWNTLLTAGSSHYEPGAFDVRTEPPRRTALATLIESLARGTSLRDMTWLGEAGWWQRRSRLLREAERSRAASVPSTAITAMPAMDAAATSIVSPRPLVVIGASGTLGRAFGRICERRGMTCRLLTRQQMDIADPGSVNEALDALRPWAVINAAGYVRVDEAESDAQRCMRENRSGPENLALACALRQLPLVTFSSDLVFDGASTQPYCEIDPVRPLSVYGRSKAAADACVLQRHPGALVIRTSAFFGPWDDYNFVTCALRMLSDGRVVRAADDQVVSPTYIPDLVDASLDLLIDRASGVWHLANQGEVSWLELARRAAAQACISPATLVGVRQAELSQPAPRPRYSALTSMRGLLLPTLEDALERYLSECSIAPVARVRAASHG